MGEAVYDYDNYHRGALSHSAPFGWSHSFCRPDPQFILQPRDLTIISQLKKTNKQGRASTRGFCRERRTFLGGISIGYRKVVD